MIKNICFLIAAFTCHIVLSQIQLENTLITERELATNLDVPWDMSYSADGWIWFTELSGKISRINPDTDELQLIFIVPDVEVFGFSAGMHSLVLHPNFPLTPYLFVHYLNTTSTSKIVRYTYNSLTETLENPIIILGNIPGNTSHNGSRMLIENDKLFICIGDSFNSANAQNLNSLNGKVLRINLDGSIPTDNPIPNSYIWSYGHRNPQGLCIGNGIMYSSEHGTSNNDEINIIETNRNYGWPNVQGYCDQSSEITFCDNENVAEPIWAWTPVIAPCGMDYFNHPSIPEWQNSLLLAVLKDKKLIQLKFNTDGTSIIEENSYLVNSMGRFRDLLVIPDGRIYLCTSNRDYIGTPTAGDDKIIELKNNDYLTVNDYNLVSFTVTPNPSIGLLRINIETFLESETYLEIVSINGSSVLELPIYNNTSEINVSTLNSGMYFLKIRNSKFYAYKKIIIK